jgi:porin
MQMPMLDDAVLSNMLAQMRSLGGLRPALADAGVDITFSYYGELLSNPVGGVRQGLIYEGRLGTLIDADLDKLVGWSGATFHASIHQINGEGLSAGFVENLMLVSGIEAPATTRQSLGRTKNWRQCDPALRANHRGAGVFH